MNINEYLTSILLNSEKIKTIIKEKKEIKNLELINRLSFEVFEKWLKENINFQQKVNEMSDFVWYDLFVKTNVEKFFINYKSIEVVDRFKNMIIIFNLDAFLKLSKQFYELDSIFIKKLKLIDYFLQNIPENEEDKFKLKLFLVEKNNLEIDYVLELLKLKKNIYNVAMEKNKNKASNIKMKINSRKIKFINELEKLDE